jgi:hypothetical protein
MSRTIQLHNTRRPRQGRARSEAKSSLEGPLQNSRTWNVLSMQMPMFNNTLKKDNSVHNFIQTTDLNTVFTSSGTVPQYYARSFTLNDVAQVGSFQSLFDQYRIKEIEVWLVPGLNASTSIQGTSSTLTTVTDYDDDNTPTSLTALQQYTNATVTQSTNGHYRRWKPHVAEALYSGAFTSYGNITAPWIDIASSGVKHYGFKAGVNTSASGSATVSFQLIFRIHFQCRNVF